MSEDDIANRLALLNSTVKEQGAALSEATRAAASVTSPTVEGTPERKTSTAAEFWEDPAKEIKTMIQEQMEETIKPFREDLQAGRARTALERVTSRHPDFAERKPMIDSLLSRMGIEDPDEGTLEMLFHTAVGLQVQAGGNATVKAEDPTRVEDSQRRDPPPQHAPSSHPVAKGTEGKKEYRELTESEKEVRRMQGFKTDNEYLDWLELDDADLLTEAKTND